MKLRLWVTFWFFGLLINQLSAQNTNVTITGVVFDADNQEPIVGASVYLTDKTAGTVTDVNGQFTISVPNQKKIHLTISFVGFDEKSLIVRPGEAIELKIGLSTKSLNEVTVTGEQTFDEAVKSNQMSVERLDMRDVKLLPVIFGEVDIIKTMQLKPGVSSANEGFAGLYVRGGSADQNLILLDGFKLYNPNHLVGMFSTFNGDAISDAKLYKGDFPAQYGGRISAVLDVNSRSGNKSKFGASGGIGLISSRLAIEGPIKKGKSSFLVSGRRTYFDIFTRMINEANKNDISYSPIPDYYFHDLNAKLDFTLNDKNRVTLTGYYGRDAFQFKRSGFTAGADWGNTLIGANWVHTFTPKLYADAQVGFTGYDFTFRNTFDVFSAKYQSYIHDYTANYRLTFEASDKFTLRSGFEGGYYRFNIGDGVVRLADEVIAQWGGTHLDAHMYAGYISADYKLSPRFELNMGTRASMFSRSQSDFGSIEPRTSAVYQLTTSAALKVSYAFMTQPVHLLTTSGGAWPADMWYPAGNNVPLQQGHTYAMGFSKVLGNGKWLVSHELFYRDLTTQLDFKDGADVIGNSDVEQEFVSGTGNAYGAEFYIEKKGEKTSGWIGYTYSWSWRQFDQINNGERFNPRFDRRHDISVVLTQQIFKRLTFSGVFVFGSGNAITLPVGRFGTIDLPGTVPIPPGFNVNPVFGKRNAYRMEAYHRLDLGLVYQLKPKRGTADLTFSIYNAYNRMNPFFIYFDTIYEDPIERKGNILGFQAKQVSLLPIIPAITYNFKF